MFKLLTLEKEINCDVQQSSMSVLRKLGMTPIKMQNNISEAT